MLARQRINCDLCVVGGGMSGIAAAVSAARSGAKVVLMHERAVLGGNASSEIRMWICGSAGRDNRETGILEEIFLENAYRNPTKSWAVWDTVLYEIVKKEENITLLLNCTCMDAEVEEGSFAHGRNRRIKRISGYQMTTQRFIDVYAGYYSDCSGDSILAPLTGADFRLGREGADEYGENTVVKEADNMTMGMSCLIQGRETDKPIKYIPPSFVTKLTEETFKCKKIDMTGDRLQLENENFWYLELGGNRDSIGDTEEIRDELLGLATGMWDYVKNSGKLNSECWDLDFLGFLPGKRESRRMLGEYVITERDISNGTVFEDEVAFGGWPIDDHYPGGFWHVGVANTDYHTNPPYSIPYRALYSANVDNLFFAGRNISMTHTAMSSIRVMATCMLLGEAVGRAAAIAARNGITPHDVYLNRIDELQASLLRGDCFLPSKRREISDICRAAKLNAPDLLRNGEDRAHRIYGTSEKDAEYLAKCGEEIRYTFKETTVRRAHIVFNSDLNRDTLDGGICERTHTMRANQRLASPDMHLPKTLCRAFTLYGEINGERTKLLHVDENRKRSYDVNIGKKLDSLILVPIEGRDDSGYIPVISFDFE